MVWECVSRGVRERSRRVEYSAAECTATGTGTGIAGRGSRYIRKYKSIQDGAVKRCLACR